MTAALTVAALVVFSVVDLLMIGVALAHRLTAFSFLCLLLARGALSILGSVLHLPNAPAQVRLRARSFLVFASLLHFFVPAVGFVGMAFVLRVGLASKRAVPPLGWTTFSFEDDAFAKRPPSKRRTVSPVDLEDTLRSPSTSAEKRFQAVLQIRHLPLKQGISILKLALKDSSDEVRLFAFSRLERVRSDLEAQVRDLTDKLALADEQGKALLHLRLAEAYWEIAYLGLAEGAVLSHALGSAHDNAEAACRLRPGSAPAEFLSGRIQLLQKAYAPALTAFERAVHAGYIRIKALPYMAECAFHQQRYAEVRTMLREVAASGTEAAGFQSVVEFWQ